jgi:hypothetical protein
VPFFAAIVGEVLLAIAGFLSGFLLAESCEDFFGLETAGAGICCCAGAWATGGAKVIVTRPSALDGVAFMGNGIRSINNQNQIA